MFIIVNCSTVIFVCSLAVNAIDFVQYRRKSDNLLKMSQPTTNTPSKRSREEDSGAQTPGRTPITPSRRFRTDSHPTPSQQNPRTPSRNRKNPFL